MKVKMGGYREYEFAELVDPASNRAIVGCYYCVPGVTLYQLDVPAGRDARLGVTAGVVVRRFRNVVHIIVDNGDESP